MEPNADVREVLDAGLRAIVREMAAVMEALHNRPGGLAALMFNVLDDEQPSP